MPGLTNANLLAESLLQPPAHLRLAFRTSNPIYDSFGTVTTPSPVWSAGFSMNSGPLFATAVPVFLPGSGAALVVPSSSPVTLRKPITVAGQSCPPLLVKLNPMKTDPVAGFSNPVVADCASPLRGTVDSWVGMTHFVATVPVPTRAHFLEFKFAFDYRAFRGCP
jgi:hypothetical protein